MPACQHTTLIPSNQCIGDSLRTINTNFTVLNDELCKIPKIAGNEKSTSVSHEMDLLGCNKIIIDTAPTQQFFKKFDSFTNNVLLTSHTSSDGFTNHVYNFPYISSSKDSKPVGTFDTISENGIPQITLFWMSSAKNTETLFALNSSVSFVQPNNTTPDGPVHCFCEYNGKLIIGGAFTKIGTTTQQKLATINLEGGLLDFQLGQVGSLDASLLAGVPNSETLFGEAGYVNFIKKTSVFVTSEDQRTLFIIGGDFRSNQNGGRSLVIWDDTTKILYPFYVNGQTFNCDIIGNDAFVVGRFDFANFGLEPETLKSGKRNYSKSIFKISLLKLITNQQQSAIDSKFCENARMQITKACEINCIQSTENQLFVGGDFSAEINGVPVQQNLLAIATTGEIINSIKLIVNKPVHTMVYDKDLAMLYIGGEFTNIVQHNDFFNELKQPPLNAVNEYHRAAAFDVQIEQAPVLLETWRPRFNGTVRKLAIHNESISSALYAIGDFTQLNFKRAFHSAAIFKASDPSPVNQIGEKVDWEVETPTAPPTHTNGLLKSYRGIYIGGTFTKINGSTRFYFSEITGVGEGSGKTIAEVVWDVGGKVLTTNESLSLSLNDCYTVRAKTACKAANTVNSTVFAPLTETFKNQKAGSLCRFFIRRPCFSTKLGNLDLTDDTYNKDVQIIGWSISYI
jgi:hypothetical protein